MNLNPKTVKPKLKALGLWLVSNPFSVGLAIVAVAYLLWEREVWALRVTTLSDIPVVEVASLHSRDVRILYGEEEITSLSIVDFQIENSGSEPIRASDFETPLTISVAGRILSTPETITSTGNQLQVEATTNDEGISIAPLLLNPGDSVTLRVWLADRPEDFPALSQVNARIANVVDIEVMTATSDETRLSPLDIERLAPVLALAATLIGIAIGYFLPIRDWRGSSFSGANLKFESEYDLQAEIMASYNEAKRLDEVLDKKVVLRKIQDIVTQKQSRIEALEEGLAGNGGDSLSHSSVDGGTKTEAANIED